MEYLEVAIWAFGIPLSVGVTAEIWSNEKIWAVCVSVGVAGETILAVLHSALSAKHRILTHARDREQDLAIDAANRKALEAHWKLQPPELHPERKEAFITSLERFVGIAAFKAVVRLDLSDGLNANIAHDMIGLLPRAGWWADLEVADQPFNPRGVPYDIRDCDWIVEVDIMADHPVREAARALDDALWQYGYRAETHTFCTPHGVEAEKREAIDKERNSIWLIPLMRFRPPK